ncbi:hypothetical protein KC949_02590 [Candidatus Saccharibacteria bacterium]|nr:hypothetical protein [Candidatus Saccharibacteria bacterium]
MSEFPPTTTKQEDNVADTPVEPVAELPAEVEAENNEPGMVGRLAGNIKDKGVDMLSQARDAATDKAKQVRDAAVDAARQAAGAALEVGKNSAVAGLKTAGEHFGVSHENGQWTVQKAKLARTTLMLVNKDYRKYTAAQIARESGRTMADTAKSDLLGRVA